ncbi:hypothetical protein HYH03_000669 [Edaphochlamys debaryana]|uniref:Uncharacterized protein n=1 Tax=Edaphochlamys debaryana TaxID=47281 RepID=A0A836C7W2_9CHLO|nr:hypothetical protein HYH03_000669 [Edaphochlamys debaryana]|eukprot:KAG2502182.1 hypothetical protein HYH03_000669 [Edaphochlamys debaryana]
MAAPQAPGQESAEDRRRSAGWAPRAPDSGRRQGPRKVASESQLKALAGGAGAAGPSRAGQPRFPVQPPTAGLGTAPAAAAASRRPPPRRYVSFSSTAMTRRPLSLLDPNPGAGVGGLGLSFAAADFAAAAAAGAAGGYAVYSPGVAQPGPPQPYGSSSGGRSWGSREQQAPSPPPSRASYSLPSPSPTADPGAWPEPSPQPGGPMERGPSLLFADPPPLTTEMSPGVPSDPQSPPPPPIIYAEPPVAALEAGLGPASGGSPAEPSASAPAPPGGGWRIRLLVEPRALQAALAAAPPQLQEAPPTQCPPPQRPVDIVVAASTCISAGSGSGGGAAGAGGAAGRSTSLLLVPLAVEGDAGYVSVHLPPSAVLPGVEEDAPSGGGCSATTASDSALPPGLAGCFVHLHLFRAFLTADESGGGGGQPLAVAQWLGSAAVLLLPERAAAELARLWAQMVEEQRTARAAQAAAAAAAAGSGHSAATDAAPAEPGAVGSRWRFSAVRAAAYLDSMRPLLQDVAVALGLGLELGEARPGGPADPATQARDAETQTRVMAALWRFLQAQGMVACTELLAGIEPGAAAVGGQATAEAEEEPEPVPAFPVARAPSSEGYGTSRTPTPSLTGSPPSPPPPPRPASPTPSALPSPLAQGRGSEDLAPMGAVQRTLQLLDRPATAPPLMPPASPQPPATPLPPSPQPRSPSSRAMVVAVPYTAAAGVVAALAAALAFMSTWGGELTGFWGEAPQGQADYTAWAAAQAPNYWRLASLAGGLGLMGIIATTARLALRGISQPLTKALAGMLWLLSPLASLGLRLGLQRLGGGAGRRARRRGDRGGSGGGPRGGGGGGGGPGGGGGAFSSSSGSSRGEQEPNADPGNPSCGAAASPCSSGGTAGGPRDAPAEHGGGVTAGSRVPSSTEGSRCDALASAGTGLVAALLGLLTYTCSRPCLDVRQDDPGFLFGILFTRAVLPPLAVQLLPLCQALASCGMAAVDLVHMYVLWRGLVPTAVLLMAVLGIAACNVGISLAADARRRRLYKLEVAAGRGLAAVQGAGAKVI